MALTDCGIAVDNCGDTPPQLCTDRLRPVSKRALLPSRPRFLGPVLACGERIERMINGRYSNGLSVESKAAPECAPTQNRGLVRTPSDKERTMTIVPATPAAEARRRQAIALDYLALTRQQMEEARSNRSLYVNLAREYGLTNQAIGDALGITEARVRQIVKSN